VYVLGLTTLGDAAATLLRDGEIVAAVEEERFSRRPHHHGFPHEAVRYCLDAAGIGIEDVAHVSLYWQPWIVGRKAMLTLRSAASSPAMFHARVRRGADQVGSGGYLGMLRVPAQIRRRFGPSDFRFHYLEHHMCHAASAFLVSPFERAAILTLDGAGESATTLMATGAGNEIRPLARSRLPHSLGQFYSAVTAFLGFDMFSGEEWKVMGLAAYGTPRYQGFFERSVLSADGRGGFRLDPRVLDHHLARRRRFSDAVIHELGPPREPGAPIEERHRDIAASAQRAVEHVVLDLAGHLHRRTGERDLCLAGGVAFNSVMNGRIIEESPFERVFVQPAAGDAGCSLGAALLTHFRERPAAPRHAMAHPYLGPAFGSAECAEALRRAGLAFETLDDGELLPRLARMIAGGAVVGWFQGRAEFGPRALGNRSFLADPRRPEVRELLNEKVKLREAFRPVAPSLLEERAGDFLGGARLDPFMVTVVDVRESRRSEIPAVVHVDGSARPQTVSRSTNPRYWRLIREFERETGVPVLLNTSFNVQEPMVLAPADAIATFRRARFDALVLEDHLVVRSSS
jgi:carbamoyltransferase